ncbi:MAG: 50S ribosomal protein L20 [Candidatus Lloydbacteria bacterium]|nr:50S ribosomal protein L20 [Candidatus Lloydbacteria bacterium]
MSRVKKGKRALKRRKNILKQVKGYRFGRSTKKRQAREAIFHAGTYAFAHRRDKKRDARALWQIKINAAVRPLGFSYSAFINALKKKGIALDRKSLSGLAEHDKETFERLVKQVS